MGCSDLCSAELTQLRLLWLCFLSPSVLSREPLGKTTGCGMPDVCNHLQSHCSYMQILLFCKTACNISPTCTLSQSGYGAHLRAALYISPCVTHRLHWAYIYISGKDMCRFCSLELVMSDLVSVGGARAAVPARRRHAAHG